MESNNVDTIYPRVVEYTEWLDLDKYKGLESRSGVFIFSNFFFQVRYIGRAGAGGMVAEISDAIKNGKAAGSSKLKVLYTKSEHNAIMLERKLILRYHPVNNSKNNSK